MIRSAIAISWATSCTLAVVSGSHLGSDQSGEDGVLSEWQKRVDPLGGWVCKEDILLVFILGRAATNFLPMTQDVPVTRFVDSG